MDPLRADLVLKAQVEDRIGAHAMGKTDVWISW
jgi:hypothetical protein